MGMKVKGLFAGTAAGKAADRFVSIGNKRGEEFVEAAVVMPLLILTILSMITIAVILFRFQISQQEAHVSLITESAGSKSVFTVLRKGASASGTVRGTASGNHTESKSYRAYAISQADAIMIGELTD